MDMTVNAKLGVCVIAFAILLCIDLAKSKSLGMPTAMRLMVAVAGGMAVLMSGMVLVYKDLPITPNTSLYLFYAFSLLFTAGLASICFPTRKAAWILMTPALALSVLVLSSDHILAGSRVYGDVLTKIPGTYYGVWIAFMVLTLVCITVGLEMTRARQASPIVRNKIQANIYSLMPLQICGFALCWSMLQPDPPFTAAQVSSYALCLTCILLVLANKSPLLPCLALPLSADRRLHNSQMLLLKEIQVVSNSTNAKVAAQIIEQILEEDRDCSGVPFVTFASNGEEIDNNQLMKVCWNRQLRNEGVKLASKMNKCAPVRRFWPHYTEHAGVNRIS